VTEAIELDPGIEAVWRRRWLLFVAALVCGALAAGYTLLSRPVYTTSTLVEVGRVMGDELEDAYAVAQMVNSPAFQQAAASRRSGSANGVVTAEALTGGQGRLEHPTLVRITASADSPGSAVDAGQAAAAELTARHKIRFDSAVAGFREQARILGANPASEVSGDLLTLQAKLASPIYTSETRLEDPFPTPSAPVPRNTWIAAAVGFLVGLAVLTLLVAAYGQVGGARAE